MNHIFTCFLPRLRTRLPLLLILALIALSLIYGPIVQPADYHRFADQTSAFGILHAADVLSNLAFALVGVWGYVKLAPARMHQCLQDGWPGYRLFLIALILTAVGSTYYHLAPDNIRLIWDRLPIALACAALLAAVRAETHPAAQSQGRFVLFALSAYAVVSVAWWYFTGANANDDGNGDLRPYLLLQVSPLFLIPLWQWIAGAPQKDREAFGIAIILYIVAKLAELYDHEIMTALGTISGHTLKHLLAASAAAVIVWRLIRRVDVVADVRVTLDSSAKRSR